MNPSHAQVVDAFNSLGYSATFAAVAERLGTVDATTLYHRYSSREALGEAWLFDEIPSPPPDPSRLHDAFSQFVLSLLRSLEGERDFGRAWLAALKVTGPLHLPQVRELHDGASSYFLAWLDANQSALSFPANVRYEDVRTELCDAFCAIALWLIVYWETDRSLMYARTLKMVDSIAYLLDALLIRRADFGNASLLVHLHFLHDQQHQQFLKPLLDILVKPERAGRYADPVSLLEALRMLRPSPAQRP